MPVPRTLALLAVLCAVSPATAEAATPVAIVAAESVYADIARQIGGPAVRVASVLSNPDQDPHVFEADAGVARALAQARIVILNGGGYDPWMGAMLAAGRGRDRTELDVGALAGRRVGDNPHLWFDTAAVLALARALAGTLARDDPDGCGDYAARLSRFDASLAPIRTRIADLRRRWAGTPVAATEPLYGAMFASLGLAVRDQQFQIAVMNGTEPSASDTAAFERDLAGHGVRLLLYNTQATDPTAERMRRLARQAGIPVVGVTETEPAGTPYQAWLLASLDAVDAALSRP